MVGGSVATQLNAVKACPRTSGAGTKASLLFKAPYRAGRRKWGRDKRNLTNQPPIC
jgi:hypothetical protein